MSEKFELPRSGDGGPKSPHIDEMHHNLRLSQESRINKKTRDDLGAFKKISFNRPGIQDPDLDSMSDDTVAKKPEKRIFSFTSTNDQPATPGTTKDDGLTAGLNFRLDTEKNIGIYGGLDIVTRKIYGSFLDPADSNLLRSNEYTKPLHVEESEETENTDSAGKDVIGGERIDRLYFGAEMLVLNERLDLGDAGFLYITGTVQGELSSFGSFGGEQIQHETHRYAGIKRYHALEHADGFDDVGLGVGSHLHIRYLPGGVFELYADAKVSIDTYHRQLGSISGGVIARKGKFSLDIGLNAQYEKWPNKFVTEKLSTDGVMTSPTLGFSYDLPDGMKLGYRFTGKCMGVEEKSCSAILVSLPIK